MDYWLVPISMNTVYLERKHTKQYYYVLSIKRDTGYHESQGLNTEHVKDCVLRKHMTR